MKNISDKVVEKIKTHLMFSNFLFFENHAVYEQMWKDIVEPGSPQMTIWRMRIVSWLLKVAVTHT
jgi:hypothetical protein